MIKILHIAAHLGGGAGKAVSGIVTELNEYKNDILILEQPESKKYYDICLDKGVNVVVSSDEEYILLAIKKYDIIVLNWWGHPLFYKVFKILNYVSARIVLWSHVNGISYPYLTYNFLNKMDGIIFTSPCSLENNLWTGEELKYIKSNSAIVYGMGDFQPYYLPYKKIYKTDTKIRIGYVGTLNYSKINKKFATICRSLAEYNNDIEIELYGDADVLLINDLKNSLEDLYGNISFKGYCDNIKEKLVSMDLFFYPLSENNFATTENALIEAMAAGLPVVVLNNPAERNIVCDSVNGLVSEDINDFCNKIKLLCDDDSLRERLGQNARRFIIENYDKQRNVSEFRRQIEKVIRSPKKLHNFIDITGTDPFDFFYYLCNKEYDEDLSVYKGDSKGSPAHFLKYYKDNIKFIELITRG